MAPRMEMERKVATDRLGSMRCDGKIMTGKSFWGSSASPTSIIVNWNLKCENGEWQR